MKRIENREILQQVRKETSEKIEKSRCRILICAGTGCLAGGSGEIYEKMCELTAENPDVDVFFGPKIAHTEAEQKTGPVEVKKSGCHGFCEMGPLMRIEPMGILYTKVQLSDCEEIFQRTIERGDVIRHLLFKQDGIEYKKQEEIPFYKKQTRNVLKNCGHIDSEHIQEYIASGGYRALEKVLFEMTPAQVIDEISESNLRGRGGGGIKEDGKFKAVQIGGPSGGCLVTRHLDVNLDFDSLKKMGAMIGSGGLVVMDDHTCMVEVARFFMNFTQNESCGKCVPCREGTKRMLEILERIVAGNGKLEDLDLLEELANMITETALCGLGKSAALPVVSTLKLFLDEYVEHVVDKKCVSHTCTALRRYIISPERCKGCSKCARNCPVGAISGRIKEPFVIDNDKCIKCGACESSCAFGAIHIEE